MHESFTLSKTSALAVAHDPLVAPDGGARSPTK